MLSTLDRSVLKAVIVGNRTTKKISGATGIPDFVAERSIERLIQYEYIDMDLQPTDKAFREIKLLNREHGFSFFGEDLKKIGRLIIDLGTAVGVIILISFILYYLGLVRV
ncbi:MAG: hypothetical protein R6U44_09360 [Archaeoglobaceae archaeon]